MRRQESSHHAERDDYFPDGAPNSHIVDQKWYQASAGRRTELVEQKGKHIRILRDAFAQGRADAMPR